MPKTTSIHAPRAASLARAGRFLRSAGSALALVVATTLVGCDPMDSPRVDGCDDTTLRPVVRDAAERGPWTVGVRTVEIEGLRVEVWYPAGRFPEAQRRPVFYDLRESLSADDAKLISGEDTVRQPCDCYRDVVPDLAHGPYPVVVFLHGHGGTRTQSLPQMLHWASRGFVVLAADHPGLRLQDALAATGCSATTVPSNVRRDVEAMLAAARGEGHALEFLGDHLDATRVAIAGHSAGGKALASMGDLAQVLIPMAAKGVEPGHALESTLVLGGTADRVVRYVNQRRGYATSPEPKRLVGLAGAGHNAFSTACTLTNSQNQGPVEVMAEAGVCGATLLARQLQCGPGLLPEPRAWEVIDIATAAVLEETLQCDPRMADAFETLRTDYSTIAEVREDL
jgi:hypothetical protein